MARSRKGFTLIELLIVVVIIGILAAIAIPKFGNTKNAAMQATLKADLRSLATAQETYFSQFNTYMTSTFNSTYYQPSANVNISFGTFNAGLWGATATMTGLSGKNCTISYGGTSTLEGAPNCN